MKGQNRGRPLEYKTIYTLLYVLASGPKGLNEISREVAKLRGWDSSRNLLSKNWILSNLRRLNALGLIEQDPQTKKWKIVENKRRWVMQLFFDQRFQDWIIYKLSTTNPIFTFGPEAGKHFRDVIPPPRNIRETIMLYSFIQQIFLGRICPACIDEGWIAKMTSQLGPFSAFAEFTCNRGHVFKVDRETSTWLEALAKA
jgi:hypothetical protein